MNIILISPDCVKVCLYLPETTTISDVYCIVSSVLNLPNSEFRLSLNTYQLKDTDEVRSIPLGVIRLSFSDRKQLIVFAPDPESRFCVGFKGASFAGETNRYAEIASFGEFFIGLRFFGACKSMEPCTQSGDGSCVIPREYEEVWTSTIMHLEFVCVPKTMQAMADSSSSDSYFRYIIQNSQRVCDRAVSMWFIARKVSFLTVVPDCFLLKVVGAKHRPYILTVHTAETIGSVASVVSRTEEVQGIRLLHQGRVLDDDCTVASYKLKPLSECTIVYSDSYVLHLHDLYGRSATVVTSAEIKPYQLISTAKGLQDKWQTAHSLLYQAVELKQSSKFELYNIPSGANLTILNQSDRTVTVSGIAQGSSFTFPAKSTERYIGDLKMRIQSTFHIPMHKQQLFYVGELKNGLKLCEYYIENGAELLLLPKVSMMDPSDIDIYVYFIDKSVKKLTVLSNAQVTTVKSIICTECEMRENDGNRLIFNGKIMQNCAVLRDEGVKSSASLYFVSHSETLIHTKLSPKTSFAVPISPTNTISDIAKTIAGYSKIPHSHIWLFQSQNRLWPDDLLSTCCFTDGEIIDVRFPQELELLFYPTYKKPFSLSVNASDSVLSLKQTIARTTTIPADQQILIYGGVPLENSHLLSVYNLYSGDSILLADTNAMRICVRTPLHSTFEVFLNPRSTVKNVKQQLRKTSNIPAFLFKLYTTSELQDQFLSRFFECSLYLRTDSQS